MKYKIVTTIRSGYWWEDHWIGSEDHRIISILPTIRMRIWATAQVNTIAIMESTNWKLLHQIPEDETLRRKANAKIRKVRMWLKDISEITGVPLCATYDDKTGEIESSPQNIGSYMKGHNVSENRVEKLVLIPVGVSNVKDILLDHEERSARLKQLYNVILDAKTTAFKLNINTPFKLKKSEKTEVAPAFIRRQGQE